MTMLSSCCIIYSVKTRIYVLQIIFQLTNQDGVGRLLECSGAVQMASIMFQLMRKGGHIVLVGLVKQPLIIENYMRDLG